MPKFVTYTKYPFKAERWTTIILTDPTGQPITNWKYLKETKCNVLQNAFGRATLIFSIEDGAEFKIGDQLRGLMDSKGNELYPGGVWTLKSVMPIITPFGHREGFRSEAEVTHISKTVTTTPGSGTGGD